MIALCVTFYINCESNVIRVVGDRRHFWNHDETHIVKRQLKLGMMHARHALSIKIGRIKSKVY